MDTDHRERKRLKKFFKWLKGKFNFIAYRSRVACVCDQISRLPEHEQTMVYFYMKKKRNKRFTETKLKVVN